MHYYALLTHNALYMVMVMVMRWVRVKPHLAYNYDYTALYAHYKYVHNALWMDAFGEVFFFLSFFLSGLLETALKRHYVGFHCFIFAVQQRKFGLKWTFPL